MYHPYLVFFFSLFFFITPSHAQLTSIDSADLDRFFLDAELANEDGNFELVFSKMDSFVALSKQKNAKLFAIMGLGFKAYYAEINFKLNVYYESLLEEKKLLSIVDKDADGFVENGIFLNNINLGLYYLRRGSYNRAQKILDELHNNSTGKVSLDVSQRINILWNLTSLHTNKANYKLALGYLNEWEALYLSNLDADFGVGFEGLINKFKGDIYFKIKNNKLSESAYLRAVELLENISAQNRNEKNRVLTTLNALATFYKKNNRAAEAIIYLNKSLALHAPNDPFFSETYRVLGETYTEIGDTLNAIVNFQKSINNNQYDLKNYQLAETYLAIGKMYAEQSFHEQAINYYQKALINLEDNFNSTDFCDNPENLEEVFAKQILLSVLHNKMLTLFELSKKKPEYLACSWETIKLAIKLIDNIKIDNSGEYAKQFLVEESYPIFEDAIRISLAQKTQKGKDFAFEIAERSKATLLLSAVRNTQVSDFLVPDSLIDLEQQVKFELQTAEENRYDLIHENKSIKQIDTEISILRKQLDGLNTFLQKQYPNYYAFRYDNRIVNVQQVQQRLSQEKVFVEYFIGEKDSYAFIINKNQPLEVVNIPTSSDSIKPIIQDCLYAIYIPYINSTEEEIIDLKVKYSKNIADKIYAEKGHQLYQLLVAPILRSSSAGFTSLEIIPDGVLNYLPFGALLEEKVDAEILGYYENQSDYQYLARKYNISQCYSATLMDLMQENNSSNSPPKGLLVFDDKDFLTHSSTINNIFSKFSWITPFVNILGENSSRQFFREESSQYRYLHFSVHGDINHERPNQSNLKLRATDNQLDSLIFLRDIYNTSLPAEMVFTSACNAGVGTLAKGEGLLSLARGFAYAGAKSLITTLWEIKGGPSNQIINVFYSELSNGQTKDKALALAKRKQMNEPLYAHPYYWAGFVSVGDMKAIDLPIPLRTIIGIVLGCLGIGLLFLKFRKTT